MSELFPAKLIYLEAFRGAKDTEVSHLNRWYDKVWVPAARELPGVVSVHRYIFESGEVPEFFKPLEADGRRYLKERPHRSGNCGRRERNSLPGQV